MKKTRILFSFSGPARLTTLLHINVMKETALRQKKGGKNIRNAPALFISPDILVDFTDQTEEEMRICGIDKESIHHLVITHGHKDHFQPVAIHNFASILPHPLTIYGNRMVKNSLDFATTYRWNHLLENFAMTHSNPAIQVKIITSGETFTLGEIKITPVLSGHMIDKKYLLLEQQALNYIFERGEKTLFYGIDSSYVLPKTFEILSMFQFDIAVFDVTFGHLKIDPFDSGHQNFAMLEKTIAQFRRANMFKENAVIVANHISQHHVEPHDEIVDELSRKGITLAYDGMVLEF